MRKRIGFTDRLPPWAAFPETLPWRGEGTFGENRTHVSTVKQTTRESNPARSDLESNLRTLRVAYLSPWSLCALLPVGTLVGPAIEHEVLGHCMTVGA